MQAMTYFMQNAEQQNLAKMDKSNLFFFCEMKEDAHTGHIHKLRLLILRYISVIL